MVIRTLIRQALKEDIGRKDITTEAIIPEKRRVKAKLVANENFVACGLDTAKAVFKEKDKRIKFTALIKDGALVKKGAAFAHIEGKARSILTAERVTLNFLTFLSGVATKTRDFVDAVKPFKVKILDTRKTIPGLRELQKYAVRTGGGYNHRMKLDQMILVKDNHLKITGSFDEIKKKIPKGIKLEIEVENLRQFKEALKIEPDIIMLDNMSLKEMKEAVRIRNNLSKTPYHRMPKLEASGGITLKNIKRVASCGVDTISVGSLTHSVKSVDISLEIE